jgi:hypothetical protein
MDRTKIVQKSFLCLILIGFFASLLHLIPILPAKLKLPDLDQSLSLVSSRTHFREQISQSIRFIKELPYENRSDLALVPQDRFSELCQMRTELEALIQKDPLNVTKRRFYLLFGKEILLKKASLPICFEDISTEKIKNDFHKLIFLEPFPIYEYFPLSQLAAEFQLEDIAQKYLATALLYRTSLPRKKLINSAEYEFLFTQIHSDEDLKKIIPTNIFLYLDFLEHLYELNEETLSTYEKSLSEIGIQALRVLQKNIEEGKVNSKKIEELLFLLHRSVPINLLDRVRQERDRVWSYWVEKKNEDGQRVRILKLRSQLQRIPLIKSAHHLENNPEKSMLSNWKIDQSMENESLTLDGTSLGFILPKDCILSLIVLESAKVGSQVRAEDLHFYESADNYHYQEKPITVQSTSQKRAPLVAVHIQSEDPKMFHGPFGKIVYRGREIPISSKESFQHSLRDLIQGYGECHP